MVSSQKGTETFFPQLPTYKPMGEPSSSKGGSLSRDWGGNSTTLDDAFLALIEEYTLARCTLCEAARRQLSLFSRRLIKLPASVANLNKALYEAIGELEQLTRRHDTNNQRLHKMALDKNASCGPFNDKSDSARSAIFHAEKKFRDTVLHELQANMIDRKAIDHELLLAQFTTEQEKVLKAVEETQDAFDEILKDVSERAKLEATEREEKINQRPHRRRSHDVLEYRYAGLM